MIKVIWATRIRGFLNNLNNAIPDIIFEADDGSYEINSYKQRLLSKFIRLRVLNIVGLFKVNRIESKQCDYYGSFNRFLKCDKPYFIYLENPTALYHYTIGRVSSYNGKKRFIECMSDEKLKYIVCMSKACQETFETLNGLVSDNVTITTIYPLVRKNLNINNNIIHLNSRRDTLKLLFIAQGLRFVSKGGLEILDAFEALLSNSIQAELTIITGINEVDKHILERINAVKCVNLYDFAFTYDELEKIYADSDILLQPTSDDSFGLTVLEAMKGGCTLITSSLYALPELVTEGYNGFLLEPKYWFFDYDNLPNKKVWNHRKKTIYSNRISPSLSKAIFDKILILYNDRLLLENMCVNSLHRANESYEFGEKSIISQWKNIFNDMED